MSRRGGLPSRSRAERLRARRRKQGRAYLLASVLIAIVVIATCFPFSALLSQRHQLQTTASQLANLKQENSDLQSEATNLKSPGSVSQLARADYGFVQPGQKAYEVLPSDSSSSGALSGHVSLNGPVVDPGSSRSQALLGTQGDAPLPGPGSQGAQGAASGGSPSSSGGSGNTSWWKRTIDTLEFWR